MTRVYYKEAIGAFVVFDVTRPSTFDAVQKWKTDLDSKVQLPDGSPIPCVLLANKVSILVMHCFCSLTRKNESWLFSQSKVVNINLCLSFIE